MSVETETGEEFRQRGLTILTERYRELVERSKTRRNFSSVEESYMKSLGLALDTLTAMQPAGPLQPRRTKDWWLAPGL